MEYDYKKGFMFEKQVNYGWGLSLNMTGKAPEVAKRIFDTYEHMIYYVNDHNDSCVPGLLLKVIDDDVKNGVYFVTKIGTANESGNVARLSDLSAFDSVYSEIQNKLDKAFFTGANVVDTLENVPISKKVVFAQLNVSQSFSLADIPETGKQIHIIVYNEGQDVISIALPNSNNYVCLSDTALSVNSGSHAEINILTINGLMYIRTI